MSGFTPRLPLSFGDEPNYALVKDIRGLVSQNLKNIILTSPGERIMDLNFGVGLKHFLFEQNLQTTYADLTAKIEEQVKKYMPFVSIDDIIVNPDIENESLVHVEVHFFIIPTAEDDILSLTVRQ